MSENILSNLEPTIVWSIFEEITKVPRSSKKEEKIREWTKKWAVENGIKNVKEDDVGNILLAKKASPGCETYPTIIIQAHMDMVCQKESNYEIDFDNDPLSVYIEGVHVGAKGTSLGADNGIGMAYGLAALIDKDLKHGPIEVLLTVDEETGLTGAFAVEKGFFSGRYLLNVDSETIGKITISSAGGGGTDFTLPVKFENKQNHQGFLIEISGLQGGHSGVDINLPRLNAIKIGIDAILEIQDMILISQIVGGSVHNAIPRDCKIHISVDNNNAKQVSKHLNQWKKNTLTIAKASEPNVKIKIKKINVTKAISSENTKAVLNLLNDIKHGPLTFSKEITGLVQTSSNLAVIETTNSMIKFHVSTRSSVNMELELVRKELLEIAKNYGVEVIQDKAYPGWKPNPNSKFVKVVKKSYEEVIGEKVELEAIHAGLECGLFVALDPELDVTSIGPNIDNAHSPDEIVEIESVEIIWNVVKKIIENMGTLQ